MAEPKAVLFVDDERPILNSLRRLLRREPYTVHTAESGEEGLALLAEHEVQMVVSDQRMPGMTGTQFLQKVKQGWPDTVRVVLSGYAEADAIVAAINQGEVYRFVGKPWKDASLKATIIQCLEHWDMVQENRRLTEQSNRQVAELQRLNAMLEGSVEFRTRSLQLSQEMLERLPEMVLGISADGEILLTNERARAEFADLRALLPGSDIAEVLPPEVAAAVRRSLADGRADAFGFTWQDRRLRARPALLGPVEEPRGCVLVLGEEGGDDDDGAGFGTG